jgi:LytS/YehU family sensor histidine kinase
LIVHFAVESQALAAKVPNLILQPIIENAIRHGIAERIEGGQIEVRASLTSDKLRLQVSDDGAGINAGSLNGNGRKEGVGLANTRARLARVYGEEHHFALEAAPEHGTQATIEIPFISDEMVENAKAIL